MSTSTETKRDEWRVEKTIPECPTSDVALLLNWEDGLRLPWHRQELLEQIAREHNGFQLLAARLESQALTLARITGERDELLVERDRLLQILSMIVCHGCNNRIGWNETPTKYGDWTKCSSCRQARAALNPTGEREGW